MGRASATLRAAWRRLASEVEVRATSAAYLNPAWGVTDQPDFLNAVVRVRFPAHPQLLMQWLLEVEREFGRVRKRRWGPRRLDLDILAVHGRALGPGYQGHLLEIPHPGIMVRPFVLAPLLELDPGWRHPVTDQPAQEAWEALPEAERKGVQPLSWRVEG